MDEAEIIRTIHRCVDECGYSWATTCQIISRMAGYQYTEKELKNSTNKKAPPGAGTPNGALGADTFG